MSEETLNYHYGKHNKAYVTNLNNLIKETKYEKMSLEEIITKADGAIFNNAAQTWNHTFFFQTLTSHSDVIPQKLDAFLTSNFGSAEAFKEQFTKAALGLFGSGWVWLAADKEGKLFILPEYQCR
jgi:Fe-Mn family superoxide dismutase